VSDPLDLRTVNATWHAGPCAEVRVGEHVTRYVRRGNGPCVILLGADADTAPVWGPLVDLLSGTHRLVVPQRPPQCVDSTGWLRGFIEGTGLTSVAIIAGGTLAEAALELAATDDFAVRKLVVMTDATASLDEANSRVLRVLPRWDPDEALRRVSEFLAL
jgi:hypothetical protein